MPIFIPPACSSAKALTQLFFSGSDIRETRRDTSYVISGASVKMVVVFLLFQGIVPIIGFMHVIRLFTPRGAPRADCDSIKDEDRSGNTL